MDAADSPTRTLDVDAAVVIASWMGGKRREEDGVRSRDAPSDLQAGPGGKTDRAWGHSHSLSPSQYHSYATDNIVLGHITDSFSLSMP